MSRLQALAVEVFLSSCLIFLAVFFGGAHSFTALAVSAVIFSFLFFNPQVLDAAQTLPLEMRIWGIGFVGYAILITAVFSVDPIVSFGELTKWFALIVAFLFFQTLPVSSSRHFLWTICFLGILEVGYGLYETYGSANEQVLWRFKELHHGYLSGTFLNRNHFAGFLEQCFGVCFGLSFFYLAEKKRALSILFMLGTFLILTGLFLSGSRMGTLSIFAAVGGVCWLFLKRVNAFFRKAIMAVSLICLGVGGYLAKVIFGIRFLDYQHFIRDSERWQLWSATLKLISKNYIGGIGLGNYHWGIPQFQPSELIWSYSHAHNDYLEILVALGIPGGVLGLAGIYLFGKYFIKESNIMLHSNQLLFFGICISLVSFLIHGLSDFNFSIHANLFLFVTLTAVAFRLTRVSHEPIH